MLKSVTSLDWNIFTNILKTQQYRGFGLSLSIVRDHYLFLQGGNSRLGSFQFTFCFVFLRLKPFSFFTFRKEFVSHCVQLIKKKHYSLQSLSCAVVRTSFFQLRDWRFLFCPNICTISTSFYYFSSSVPDVVAWETAQYLEIHFPEWVFWVLLALPIFHPVVFLALKALHFPSVEKRKRDLIISNKCQTLTQPLQKTTYLQYLHSFRQLLKLFFSGFAVRKHV